MSKEQIIKNLRRVCKEISESVDEAQMKNTVGRIWGWLAVRSMMVKIEPVDELIANLLEFIEQTYGWDIPTMAEIEREMTEKNPPDDD